MANRSNAGSPSSPTIRTTAIPDVYSEGVTAGVIGAAVVALWFFLLDIFAGQPFYTPNFLGHVLFRRGAAIDPTSDLPLSFDMIVAYTWIHGLVFCIVGGLASKLLAIAEENFQLGFGILLFFVVFEFGFVGAAFILAERLLEALAWQKIFVGNLLAAIAMAAYFWRHHPNLRVEP